MDERDRARMSAHLKELIEEYAERIRLAPMQLREERDAAIRAYATKYGLRAVEVEDLTGFSRETVRQILRPETRPGPKSGDGPVTPPPKKTGTRAPRSS